MKLRYGIPLTIAIMSIATFLSSPSFNVYYLVVGVLALWAAWDSSKIQFSSYKPNLSLPPLGLGVAVAVVWPIAFPLYLRQRYRIMHGLVERGEPDRNAGPVFYAGVALVGLLIAFAFYMTRNMRRDLMPILTREKQAGMPVSAVNWSSDNRILTLSMDASRVRPAARDSLARAAAIIAIPRCMIDVDSVASVEVSFSTVERRGAATFQSTDALMKYDCADLFNASKPERVVNIAPLKDLPGAVVLGADSLKLGVSIPDRLAPSFRKRGQGEMVINTRGAEGVVAVTVQVGANNEINSLETEYAPEAVFDSVVSAYTRAHGEPASASTAPPFARWENGKVIMDVFVADGHVREKLYRSVRPAR